MKHVNWYIHHHIRRMENLNDQTQFQFQDNPVSMEFAMSQIVELKALLSDGSCMYENIAKRAIEKGLLNNHKNN